MTKLDGNERWNSKMLLTEHQEQYEKRGDVKKNGQPTPEELTMIRDYILLPHMLTMIQKSIDDIEHSSNLLKRFYVTAAHSIMNRISADMYDLRRELKKRNIKILGDEQEDMVFYYHFTCRGYSDRFGMVRDVIRSEISIRLAKYIQDIICKLKD